MGSIRERQELAAQRTGEVKRLRDENPEMSLQEIADKVGISKGRVQQILSGDENVSKWQKSDDRWPDHMVTMMCDELRKGVAPRELLVMPGVAEMIKVKSRRGRKALSEEKIFERRMTALRVMISRGKERAEESVAHRLYLARQAGLELLEETQPDKLADEKLDRAERKAADKAPARARR